MKRCAEEDVRISLLRSKEILTLEIIAVMGGEVSICKLFASSSGRIFDMPLHLFRQKKVLGCEDH